VKPHRARVTATIVRYACEASSRFPDGDRQSACGGVMEPIAISVRKDKEWIIIHRCTECGTLRENRVAGDDNETPCCH